MFKAKHASESRDRHVEQRTAAARLRLNSAALCLSLGITCAACGGGTTNPSTTTGGGTTVNGAFTVSNLPCVAEENTPVSCRFNATASGGQGPYTFSWKFTVIGSNSTPVTIDGASVSPTFGCGFSSGAATINVSVELTTKPASGAAQISTGTQQIARRNGVCGAV